MGIRDPVKFLQAMERRTESHLEPGIHKADGTKIRNPQAFVAKSNEPLYTAEGKQIRNLSAYIASLERTPDDPVPMFFGNGNQVKNPEAYLASCEKKGVIEPLFNIDGEEIR